MLSGFRGWEEGMLSGFRGWEEVKEDAQWL